MSMALELLIFIGLFALAIGLLGLYLQWIERGKYKLVAAAEGRRQALQPWGEARNNRRGHR